MRQTLKMLQTLYMVSRHDASLYSFALSLSLIACFLVKLHIGLFNSLKESKADKSEMAQVSGSILTFDFRLLQSIRIASHLLTDPCLLAPLLAAKPNHQCSVESRTWRK